MMRRALNFLRQFRNGDAETARGNPEAPLGWPPGHFYSPIPSLKEIRPREEHIFERDVRSLGGIELDPEGQERLLHAFDKHFREFPFQENRQDGFRFYLDNPNFGFGEATVLFAWLRHFRPRNIVEIGSGYSSCAILDIVERDLGGKTNCRFIEPYPELLLSLIRAEDQKNVTILPKRVQELGVAEFAHLGAGDLLFVDTSHVLKTDSDVNFMLFELLPSLADGVFIHFHDILFPFEYPRKWVFEGRCWNEAYALRAFLQYNSRFRIRFWNSYIARLSASGDGARFAQTPGSSIWLEKVPDNPRAITP
jgi:hypothetical protein